MGSFTKWFAFAAVALGLWVGVKAYRQRGQPSIRTLAAAVVADEVKMYSMPSCGYCAVAKKWLDENGVAFTDCDVTNSRVCEAEFMALGGGGTPYLIVRGHHMKDGFNSEEFVEALRKGAPQSSRR